jgi:hypothetical protein
MSDTKANWYMSDLSYCSNLETQGDILWEPYLHQGLKLAMHYTYSSYLLIIIIFFYIAWSATKSVGSNLWSLRCSNTACGLHCQPKQNGGPGDAS